MILANLGLSTQPLAIFKAIIMPIQVLYPPDLSQMRGTIPGNFKVKEFTRLDQYFCMVFAQLTYCESLKDIEACLQSRKRSRRGKIFVVMSVVKNGPFSIPLWLKFSLVFRLFPELKFIEIFSQYYPVTLTGLDLLTYNTKEI
jgi:hypothetical protein